MLKRKAPSQTGRPSKRKWNPPRKKQPSLAAKVERLIKAQEIKFFDTATSQTPVAATGNIVSSSLCLVQQGDTSSSRDGKRITLKGLYFKGTSRLPAATSGSSSADLIRVVIYLDKQSNGAAATIANIFSTTDINSFRNVDNSKRFVILYDEVKKLQAAGVGTGATPNTVTGEDLVYWKAYVPFTEFPLNYDASTGAITDLTSGNIGVAAFSELGLANLNFNARLRFVDL